MKYALAFALLSLCAGPASAQIVDIHGYYESFMRPIEKRGASIFFTSCQEPHGRSILYFEIGKKIGQYAEFEDNGMQGNGAGITTTQPMRFIDLGGGVGSFEIHGQIFDGMVASGFRLIKPKEIEAALLARPTIDCVKPHLH